MIWWSPTPFRWTLTSTRQLAKALVGMGHQVWSWRVAELLHLMEYRLQATAKVVEGAQNADRNDQFLYINRLAGECIAAVSRSSPLRPAGTP
jgi:hypothetical protein